MTELVLVHCNFVENAYQYDSRVVDTFTPNKPFGSLIDISPSTSSFLKICKSKFSHIQVRFTGQNSVPLELENQINLILVIN